MAKEYATVQIRNGVIFQVDIGAPNASPEANQFAGLKGYPLVYGLNKLDELGFAPLQGAVDHGEAHPGAANYILMFVREALATDELTRIVREGHQRVKEAEGAS